METRELSKDDIAAIRQADTLVFFLTKNPEYPRAAGSSAIIRAVKRNSHAKVFTSGAESSREITCQAYLPGWASKAVASAMYLQGPADGAIGALRQLIRAGDEIVLTARENGNQYTREAGLRHDELLATIRRNGKDVISEMVLVSSTCPDNTARMIR